METRCLSVFKINKRMTQQSKLPYVKFVGHGNFSLGKLSQVFFFFEHFVFFPRARVGVVKKSDEKHRKKKHMA